jgi:type II secretory pathway pseudopilin PulG
MERDKYLKERVDDQISWYDAKSSGAQRRFKQLRSAEIICAALVPFLAGFTARSTTIAVVVGLLGAIIVVLAAFQSLGQYQESWLDYRMTCEALKHEKYLFLTRAEPYAADDAFPLLVERIENLITKENSTWSQQTRAGLKPSLPPGSTE